MTILTIDDLDKLIKTNKNILKEKFSYKYYEINIYLYTAMYGTSYMLKYLESLDKNIIHSMDLFNNNAYILAAGVGNFDVMKYLENNHKFMINLKNNISENAYLYAAKNGQLNVIKYFFKYPSIFKKNKLEILQSLVIIFIILVYLCIAIYFSDKNLYKINIFFVELFFSIICILGVIDLSKQFYDIYDKYYINYFIKNFEGYNVYFCALINGHLDIMKYLEKKEKYNWNILNFVNYLKEDAYLLAIKHGHLHIIKYFEKKYKWNLTTKDWIGNDAYLVASLYGNLHVIKYLEQTHNWSINVKNNKGNNAYLLAIIYNHLEIMKYLEQKRSWSINFTNNIGNNAYLTACNNNTLQIMKYLDETHNINIYHKNKNGFNVYSMAVNRKYLKIMKYLDKFHKWNYHNYSSNNKEISEYLEKFKIKKRIKVKNNINETCIICLEDFIKNEKICKCTNGHIFHMNCYANIKNKQECCLCRKNNIIMEYYFLFPTF